MKKELRKSVGISFPIPVFNMIEKVRENLDAATVADACRRMIFLSLRLQGFDVPEKYFSVRPGQRFDLIECGPDANQRKAAMRNLAKARAALSAKRAQKKVREEAARLKIHARVRAAKNAGRARTAA